MFRKVWQFLDKVYTRKRIKRGTYLCLPIITDKSELEDHKEYKVLIAYKSPSGKFKRWYFTSYKWDSRYDCFTSCNEPRCKFEDEQVFVLPNDIILSPYIFDFDPRTINAADIQAIKEITFRLSDENTSSDDIWESLITYFDDRGLSE